jgi:hypothetical protein
MLLSNKATHPSGQDGSWLNDCGTSLTQANAFRHAQVNVTWASKTLEENILGFTTVKKLV